MGCSIHAFIDFDEGIDNKGELIAIHFATLDLDANYALYALMADVRNYWNLVSLQPKGLPERISRQVKEANCYQNQEWKWVPSEDYHSHSWFNTLELELIIKRFETFSYALQDLEEEDDKGLASKMPYVNELLHKIREHKAWADKDRPRILRKLDAILAMMKALDRDQFGRTRLIFWFDN